MQTDPLVSVIITTYNQAAYIGQAIESVLAQTYPYREVIVVDDGSKDETPSKISPFVGRVSYMRQKNQGIAGSRNTGIRKARGELIAFLDGDDLWDPEKLAVQVELARAYPKSGLIAVDGLEFNDSVIMRTSLFSGHYWKELPENAVASGNYYHQLLRRQFISTTSQVMVPARVFEAIGLSDGRFSRANDWDLYIRIAALFDVTVLKKRLMKWRYLQTSASGPRTMRDFSYLPEEVAVLKHHMRKTRGLDREMIRRLVRARLTEGAEDIYYMGLRTDRLCATRLLLKLFMTDFNSLTPFIFLMGLWSPRRVTGSLGRSARRMIAGHRGPSGRLATK